MLDTGGGLRVETSCLMAQPINEDQNKVHGLKVVSGRSYCSSVKEVLQLKLQQRRTRQELVSQGIMPPLTSPAAFHRQRKSLERARTEDYLKRKIRSRPERAELVRMHILEETSAEPSLQAKQLKLKRARLADDLNDKISHRPGPIELLNKNILPVHTILGTESSKEDSSSLDEDSSDAMSPDQSANYPSPLGSASQLSPSNLLPPHSNSPLTQVLPLTISPTDGSTPLATTSGGHIPVGPQSAFGQAQVKPGAEKPPQRPKKAKDSKPKVKKLKYHQYIPPDQKAEREPPPQMDSSYAKILQQQQLFLQLQIISQQQQHYNYHTILPAPPKPLTEQPATPNTAPAHSRTVPATSTVTPSGNNGSRHQGYSPTADTKPCSLPDNLDDFKVAELKQELKLRGLTVSGTKNDLIERLRNYQQNNGAGSKHSKLPALLTTEQVCKAAEKVGGAASQNGTPPRIMHLSSTSSTPPASPTPSDRSVAGMRTDESSCNGDVFGEMVSSPLTHLSLQQSPEHWSSVKEEPVVKAPKPSCGSQEPTQPKDSREKDLMLLQKDKQIEELTRMLLQKQRLVETLRSQLEQGEQKTMKTVPAVLTSMETVRVMKLAEDKKTPQPILKLKLQTQQTGLKTAEQRPAEGPKQQASQMLISQPSAIQVTAKSIKLAHLTPTLLTDNNGNHYLIAVSNGAADGRLTVTPQKKGNGRITLQRLLSAPVKLPSQSQAATGNQSNQWGPNGAARQESRKKPELHLDTSGAPQEPPTLPSFFLREDSSVDQVSSPPPVKENRSHDQQIDDLFEILVQSGETSSGIRSNSDPTLSPLPSTSPSLSPSPPSSPVSFTLSPPPNSPLLPRSACTGSKHLEEFLERTTGASLLGGAEPDTQIPLIDELHTQMLSTPSFLDQPSSPMDTSELSFNPQPTSLDLSDSTLDTMDWLDMPLGGGGRSFGDAGTAVITPAWSQTPPSVFSADFLDSPDLQLHWDGL
ncbi:myocardin related transcription factor Ab isoform X2 [Denticeps clupeoides]|uniref:SAP domain-containing protein n=1 Tax=Denticeps clupeoides TaxID=299321 RepID=A0AAY4C5G1_9TELE|nr:myocardin-related transcription factor A-like isoform X2 [Denticeps clupeoides]